MSASHEEDSYKVDGAELATVKIVGTMTSMEEHTTNINFKVNDGTGMIDCKQWVEQNSTAHSKLSGLRFQIKVF
jgi:replication factor A2